MFALESVVLTAWYCSRPEIRRLLAIRDTDGLRVLVQPEPAQDSSETHPAWMANRREWTDELCWHTGTPVRLERLDEGDEGESNGRPLIVADLFWRNPSSFI